MKKENQGLNVGIDVGKFQLDIYIREKQEHFTVTNDSEGIRSAINKLNRYQLSRIVIEATGRYEAEFVCAAHNKKLPVCIVKPIAIRLFARACDQLAKTDKIDAMIIAEFAHLIQPRITSQKSKNLILIKDLVTRRKQLINMRTKEKNRIKVMPKSLHKSYNNILNCINREITKIENQLTKIVEEESAWSDKKSLLETIPGVGKALIWTILSDLPEIGTLTNKEIAKLTGVAPINRDSGKMKGKRRVFGGRETVRTTLYMATLSATQHNPIIRQFYLRLVNQGKHKKVAITAAMRKLITIINAMMKTNSSWNNA